MAQAVPGYPPPKALTDHLARLVAEPGSHRYTEIEGLPSLRHALAEHMSGFYGAPIGADSVAVTAGCNQAYCLAMQVLCAPGDEVILPQPAYFNHQMWLDGLGIRAVHLPFRPDRKGVPDPEEARRLIGPKTRAIVLVTPNNPTGAVYPASEIRRFYDLARERGIALVADEPKATSCRPRERRTTCSAIRAGRTRSSTSTASRRSTASPAGGSDR